MRVLDTVDRVGAYTPNRSGLPIVELPIADHTKIAEVGRFLFDRGVYVTLAAFPLVPKAEVGVRAQLTAANTDDEVFMLTETIEELATRLAAALLTLAASSRPGCGRSSNRAWQSARLGRVRPRRP